MKHYIEAYLANQVYTEGGGHPPKGWSIYDHFYPHKENGLGVCSYINHEEKRLVVAVRGSCNRADYIDDFWLLLGFDPSNAPHFERFVRTVSNQLKNDKEGISSALVSDIIGEGPLKFSPLINIIYHTFRNLILFIPSIIGEIQKSAWNPLLKLLINPMYLVSVTNEEMYSKLKEKAAYSKTDELLLMAIYVENSDHWIALSAHNGLITDKIVDPKSELGEQLTDTRSKAHAISQQEIHSSADLKKLLHGVHPTSTLNADVHLNLELLIEKTLGISRFNIEMKNFNRKQNQFLKENPGYTISVVGHSLGASMAELVAFKQRLPAIVFDSPGSLSLLESQNFFHQVDLRELITNYFAAPSFINTLNKHPGKQYRLYIRHIDPVELDTLTYKASHLFRSILDTTKRGALLITPLQAGSQAGLQAGLAGLTVTLAEILLDIPWSLRQHSINNMLACFNKETLKPHNYSIVYSWPYFSQQSLSLLRRLFIEFLPFQSHNIGLHTYFFSDEDAVIEAQIENLYGYNVSEIFFPKPDPKTKPPTQRKQPPSLSSAHRATPLWLMAIIFGQSFLNQFKRFVSQLMRNNPPEMIIDIDTMTKAILTGEWRDDRLHVQYLTKAATNDKQALVCLPPTNYEHSPFCDIQLSANLNERTSKMNVFPSHIGRACKENDLAIVLQYVKTQLQTHDTKATDIWLSQVGYEMMSVTLESSMFTGSLLLLRDMLLNQGYSYTMANRFAYGAGQIIHFARMAAALYQGADKMLIGLPLVASNLTYHSTLRLSHSQRLAHTVSSAASIVMHWWQGQGLLRFAGQIFSSSLGSGLATILEESFANRYLTTGLSQKFSELSRQYQDLLQQLPESISDQLRRQLEELEQNIQSLLSKDQEHLQMDDYVHCHKLLNRIESMKQQLPVKRSHLAANESTLFHSYKKPPSQENATEHRNLSKLFIYTIVFLMCYQVGRLLFAHSRIEDVVNNNSPDIRGFFLS